MMPKCPPPDQLRAFYMGQLADDLSDALVAHVGICSVCQAELETVVDGEDSLISRLREPNVGSHLDREPACEMGTLRALDVLETAREPAADKIALRDQIAAVGKSIGEYEILGELGQGGMGQVYLARHSKLGRLVALKTLAGHRLGDRRASQRFESEMQAIGRLSHPNIVIAHDAREIEGTAVLVTEFIDGFDLGQLLQRSGPLAVSDACEIARQVALALQYLCDAGYVHRDVKPSNIMLSANGEVKLLDLGLARLLQGEIEQKSVTGTGQTMGTADYISPEQVNDSRRVDVRSDIYSLGATLFKLLLGRAPFADDTYSTAFAKMTAHVATSPQSLRSLRCDVPDALSQLVICMLAKRPEDRPQEPALIAEKLAVFSEGSNLKLLFRNAAQIDVACAQSSVSNHAPNSAPRTQTVWYRPVPLRFAIATGFAGGVLGFCFGIVVMITNPDGSKTVMHLPEGSKVEVREGESNVVKDTVQVESTGDSAIPVPTFNGHTLAEWLNLLQTEESRTGQIAAIAGIKGLLNKRDFDRIRKAILSAIDSRKSRAVEEFALLKLVVGEEAYGQWLIEQLNKGDTELTKAILNGHTLRYGNQTALNREHHLIATWLADSRHQLIAEEKSTDIWTPTIQDKVESFLASILYASELKDDLLQTCIRAARNQPAIGDATTFLLGVPGSITFNFPEDERLQVFAGLALEKLLSETSTGLQVTRSMSILTTYPQLIPNDKIKSLTQVTQKRFAEVCRDPDRIGALVDRTLVGFTFVPSPTVYNPQLWNLSASRASEPLSLLYFTLRLGSPSELEDAIENFRKVTQPAYARASEKWQELARQHDRSDRLYLVWPFDQKLETKNALETGQRPELWRAAYYDLVANLVVQSFERRKIVASELADSEAVNHLDSAMRDFARVDNFGLGIDIRVHDIERTRGKSTLSDPVLDSLQTNFQSIDRNRNAKISVVEYARFLSERDVHR